MALGSVTEIVCPREIWTPIISQSALTRRSYPSHFNVGLVADGSEPAGEFEEERVLAGITYFKIYTRLRRGPLELQMQFHRPWYVARYWLRIKPVQDLVAFIK